MKIKIIDLIEKLENNDAPSKIKFATRVLYFDEELQNYYDEEGNHPLFDEYIGQRLYFEVEIMKEDKKIEKLMKTPKITAIIDEEPKWSEQYELEDVGNKINEIIDKLNEMSDK